MKDSKDSTIISNKQGELFLNKLKDMNDVLEFYIKPLENQLFDKTKFFEKVIKSNLDFKKKHFWFEDYNMIWSSQIDETSRGRMATSSFSKFLGLKADSGLGIEGRIFTVSIKDLTFYQMPNTLFSYIFFRISMQFYIFQFKDLNMCKSWFKAIQLMSNLSKKEHQDTEFTEFSAIEEWEVHQE